MVGFLSIRDHEKSTVLLSLAFARRDGVLQKRTHLLAVSLEHIVRAS